MIKMQSSMLNTVRHQPSASRAARRLVVRLRGTSHLSGSNTNLNQSSPLTMSPKMDHNGELESNTIDQASNSVARNILRNSLYLTFNAPQVDDYVCLALVPP